MKECKLCCCTKERDDFYVDSSKKTGTSTYCKLCSISKRAGVYKKNKPTEQAYQNAYHAANKDQAKKRNRKYLYGIEEEQYQVLRASQLFSCFICSKKECDLARGLFVDHCHKTGKVRGLLCQHCNTLLGMANDNQDTLERAIKYLNEHSTERTL
jgi:hypothetical protein